MTDEDIVRVRQIERISFSEQWAVGSFAAELRNPSSRLTVAALRRSASFTPPEPSLTGARRAVLGKFPAGMVLGYLGFWVVNEEMHVMNTAVDPAWRRQSIGRLLFIDALNRGRELGALRATLEVRVSNTSARRLYEEIGFVAHGVRPRYYLDNGEDAVVMWIDNLWTPEFCFRYRQVRRKLFG